MNDISLACFLSVARTLNFSVSAQVLSIPQQSVSRNIQRLEEELGYTLLNRDSQTVTLTQAGRDFSRWVLNFDQRLKAVDLAIRRVPSSLGIGWGDWTGCPEPVERAIRSFQQQHPMVSLHVTQGSHQELIDFLRSGLVDLVLLPERCVGEAPGLQLEESGISLPLYVLVGADNPLRALKGEEQALLATLPQLTPPLVLHPEEGQEVAVSDLFQCAFARGEVRQMPNVHTCYVGLLGSTACTLSPMNPWLAEQERISILCDTRTPVELVFAKPMGQQNPWCNIMIQLVREAMA